MRIISLRAPQRWRLPVCHSPVFDLCPIRSPVQADAQLYKTALYDLHLKLQGKVSNARSLSSDVLVDVIPAQPGTVFSLTVGPGLVSAHL